MQASISAISCYPLINKNKRGFDHHTHSDHVAGLDDLVFTGGSGKLPLYTTAHHGVDIQKRSYMFEKGWLAILFSTTIEMKIIAAGDDPDRRYKD